MSNNVSDGRLQSLGQKEHKMPVGTVDVEHTGLGRLTLPGPPLRFFDGADGADERRLTHAPPPRLDEHGAAIRAWVQEPDA